MLELLLRTPVRKHGLVNLHAFKNPSAEARG